MQLVAMDPLPKKRINFINKIRNACSEFNQSSFKCPKCLEDIDISNRRRFHMHLKRHVVPRWKCIHCSITLDEPKYAMDEPRQCKANNGQSHDIILATYNYETLYNTLRKEMISRVLPIKYDTLILDDYSATDLNYLSFEQWYMLLFGPPRGEYDWILTNIMS